MSPATFFTIFWMLYYPLCLAFYQFHHYEYIDEVLTLVLIFYAILKLRSRLNGRIMNEVTIYLLLMTFYVVYSLLIHVTVSGGVWNDLQQQVRPYAVFYTAWLLAPRFNKWQTNTILLMMIVTTVIYFFTYRGMSALPGGGYVENVIIGQLALVAGMAYYLFKPRTTRSAVIATLIVSIGLFGGKFKFMGEYVCFIAIVWFLRSKIKLSSPKFLAQLALLATVVLFFTWDRFNSYYVEGFTEQGLREKARPATYNAALKIFRDYFPFGSGLGSFATIAAWRHYSPLYYKYELNKIWGLDEGGGFIADAFYPVLAEYGIVGVIFFLVFWRRRIREVVSLRDVRYYKMGLMAILALALESVADSSYLSGKGMGYFMLLALCVAASYREQRLLALRRRQLEQQAQK